MSDLLKKHMERREGKPSGLFCTEGAKKKKKWGGKKD